MKALPTQSDYDAAIRDLLAYNPETGLVTRSRCTKNAKEGQAFGSINKGGYLGADLSVMGKKKNFIVHRVAWFLHYGVWPGLIVDHRDRSKTNNRIDNLREVDARVNAQNRHINEEAGVLMRADNQFLASIRIDGWRHTLGTYTTREMAMRVYLAVKREFHPGYEWAEPTPPTSS